MYALIAIKAAHLCYIHFSMCYSFLTNWLPEYKYPFDYNQIKLLIKFPYN